MKKGLGKSMIIFAGFILLVLGCLFFSQLFLSHKEAAFTPSYERLTLTADMDGKTLFRQTGLSPAAARRVLEEQGLEGLEGYQEAFFGEKHLQCQGIFSFLTRQDGFSQGMAPTFAAPEAGDLVVSLSTHTAGWRHGHAAILLNDFALVQLTQYGADSGIYTFDSFLDLSQYAVLRLKDRPEDLPQRIFAYTLEHLVGVPYSLLGPKAPAEDNLKLMCTSLVWYPYYQLGYDVDADGGWFVSGRDLLDSPLLEVVQVYGMDPEEFIERMAQ